ncbi:hypothetical protein CACET_c09510 [Clostridium aceticum]|uniref:Uncharacterized protein n=1 Tax=Clostridium aceticum TaxID=84022 RepID=A0A0D8IEA6_9CLOT|nr:DUF2225 domain-containing protein [Clostridium aceticum]AKL94458.1 hypothetical protein CACET_c09510 [Clostridium aceticum]KJF28322.1 hypothetical protein TZ02_02845 [Clostridium aceticum]
MEHLLYDKNISCPCCRRPFTTKKVRTRALKVLERHTDFYVQYKDINPIYYYIWVCPHCGFSGGESEFIELNREQRTILQDSIVKKWNYRNYGGVRSIEEVEGSYKLALLVAQLLKKPKGYIGTLCLRLAWVYRECNDGKEIQFLQYALKSLEEAYQQEVLPVGGLDEISAVYLVGELHRKLGNPQEAIKWYSKALDHPDIKTKRQVQLMAREQWRLAKEAHQVGKECEAHD